MSRDELQQRVWGVPYRPRDRSVDVCVRKMREKIDERSEGWAYVHTHYGIGYRFDATPASERAGHRRVGAAARSLSDARRPAAARAARVVPQPGFESTATSPSWASTTCLTIASPSPEPGPEREASPR